jgi:hypothetical protein
MGAALPFRLASPRERDSNTQRDTVPTPLPEFVSISVDRQAFSFLAPVLLPRWVGFPIHNDACALAWCEAAMRRSSRAVMLQRTRQRFAPVVLSLMLIHAAALTGSSLVQAATAGPDCQCCCKGTGKTLTCPMARAQSSDNCRVRCGTTDQSALLLGLPGIPLPTFVNAVDHASEALSNHVRSRFPDVNLPVPDQPPRPTTDPR